MNGKRVDYLLIVIKNVCVTFTADLCTLPSTEALTSGVGKCGDGTFLPFVKYIPQGPLKTRGKLLGIDR